VPVFSREQAKVRVSNRGVEQAIKVLTKFPKDLLWSVAVESGQKVYRRRDFYYKRR